ncbi:MAG: glycosyltransferase family 77 protein [Crocinitomicaceae bacterium]|nr:glycosyltransferase family 77 protein [Crocinitomicaceae bacterium]
MKIISFGNYRYKRIAHNWALYLQRHKIENYTIYSLDQDIYDYLVENEINTELLPLDIFEEGAHLWDWRERLKFIFKLLNEGINVLHSDLDAIWLKNPLDLVEEKYDLIASTGTFPQNIYEKIGCTLCMGWIYYKSSTIIKELFQDILDKNTHDNFDDQIEFNRKIFNGKWQNLKLKTLDQSIISRGQHHDVNTYVAHPLSPKHIDREKLLKSKNLWILA